MLRTASLTKWVDLVFLYLIPRPIVGLTTLSHKVVTTLILTQHHFKSPLTLNFKINQPILTFCDYLILI